jgi:hypothetical protein
MEQPPSTAVKFRVAFDLDETLDFGTSLARLCNALHRSCMEIEVIILSARTATDPTVKEKWNKVERLGIVIDPKNLHVVQGETNEARAYAKAVFCRDQKIDLFIDNNRVYCDHVKTMSPHTTVLHRV